MKPAKSEIDRAGPSRPVAVQADRIAGLFFLALAVVAGTIATGFRVGFLTDPIGPRALPWLAAALLGVGGALMLMRREQSRRPDGTIAVPSSGPARPIVPAPVALAVGTFILYAIIVSFAGFIVSTALLMAVLARFYAGGWRAGVIAGGIFAVSLWLLFAYALGVPLPVGSLFTAGS